MQRVLVIGSPGAGKSTLAREIARRTGLPLVHLDQEYWQPGWVEMDELQWRAKVDRLIAEPRWIIDGNYGGSLGARLARADTVIDLEFPAWRCIGRLLRRIVSSRGRVRSDMAPGCPEQFDWEFLGYTARFPRTVRHRNNEQLKAFGGTVIRLRTPAAVKRFLETLETGTGEG